MGSQGPHFGGPHSYMTPFEMNVNIKQELDFVVDNSRRLFFDAQEAKKVSERTVIG